MKPSILSFVSFSLACACGGSAAPAVSPSPSSVPSAPSASAPAASPSPPPPPPAPQAPLTPGIVIVGEVLGPPSFDPKPLLDRLKPDFGRCYDETRVLVPGLHGKLMLQVKLAEDGSVTGTGSVPGGGANDSGLVACIADAMKAVRFPAPGGTATLTVPLVFKR